MKNSPRRLAATVALLLAFLAPRTARADCPSNLVFAGCGSATGYVVATANYGYDEILWTSGQACQRACYDLKQGHLVTRATGAGCISGLELADTYRLSGLAPGATHTFTAELHVTTTTPEPAALSARIAHAATAAEDAISVMTGEPSATRILAIALTKPEGESFDLDFDLRLLATGAQVARAEGRVFFRGLPEGMQVLSCQSYDVPVPARAVTWGRLKSSYR